MAVWAVCAGCAAGSVQALDAGSSGGSSGANSSSGTSSGSGSSSGDVDATVSGDDSSPPGSDGGQALNDAPIARMPVSDPSCAANSFTQTTFANLAVAPGAPLDRSANDAPPDAGASAVPSGWHYYGKDGAICRDGSPTGFYVRYGTASKLVIYLEGGGVCMSPHFCDHNPANINMVFPGGSLNGESFAGSLTTQAGLQAPYTTGIFDNTNSDNPYKDWNEVYVPYCTGDAHSGVNDSAMVQDGVNPFVTNTWHFVGYRNMQKFVSRLVPTFHNVSQVILTGSSAGGLGAGINYGMVQDSFGTIPVTVIDDSFPPFVGGLIPTCLQAIIRPMWGLDQVIPADCTECSDLVNIVPYWHHKYPNAKFGMVSSIHDQIIRLFLAAGQPQPGGGAACSQLDPNILSGLAFQGSDPPAFDGGMYANGLTALRDTYTCTKALSSYLIGTGDPDASDMNGTIDTLHEHIFRDRFYDLLAGPGQPTLAAWTADFINGKLTQVGP